MLRKTTRATPSSLFGSSGPDSVGNSSTSDPSKGKAPTALSTQMVLVVLAALVLSLLFAAIAWTNLVPSGAARRRDGQSALLPKPLDVLRRGESLDRHYDVSVAAMTTADGKSCTCTRSPGGAAADEDPDQACCARVVAMAHKMG